MTCLRLSDRMPDMARGAATWNAEEAEHLSSCADCQAEWAVVRAGASMGQGASVDADALATRVLQRLRTEPGVHKARTRVWLIGVAAAAVIAILLVPARLPRGPAAPLSSGPAVPPLFVDVPGLSALDTDQLADVLDSFDTSWTETSTTGAPSLDNLDPQELERIERTWEL